MQSRLICPFARVNVCVRVCVYVCMCVCASRCFQVLREDPSVSILFVKNRFMEAPWTYAAFATTFQPFSHDFIL